MPTSNFLIFDQNKANMIGDEAYKTSTQRLNGVQSGVASSMLNNKFAYQVSLVAYAIAQIMNANGIDATDTMAVSQFVNNLSSTFLQKVVDKASVADAVAASSDSKWMSPSKVKNYVERVSVPLSFLPLRAETHTKDDGTVTVVDSSTLTFTSDLTPVFAYINWYRSNFIWTQYGLIAQAYDNGGSGWGNLNIRGGERREGYDIMKSGNLITIKGNNFNSFPSYGSIFILGYKE